MNTVYFPLINLKMQINKIAVSIFGVDIYWYAVIMAIAIIAGIIVIKKHNKLYNITYPDMLDLLIFLIPISILSARIYYVIFDFKYFMKFPLQILNFRTGGMAIYGGIIGGIITCIIFCKKRKIKFLDLTDYIVPSLALGQAIGRWGNFVNVEAYGTQTNLPWKMGIYEFGKYIEVHPTFLYESIATFCLFLVLIKISKKRKFPGQLTFIFFIWYGFVRMIIEELRTDSLMMGNIKISQLISLAIMMVGIILYNINKK